VNALLQDDTIAALATPPGRGGVGIIRVSGSLVPSIAQVILGKLPQPRYAEYLPFFDSNETTIDVGIALYFPAPHSFTGEHVLELQGHGGPVVMDLLLRRVLSLGARIAQPGEFSQRAFLNDKLDLAQAEAIADLIDSSSETAARSAMQSLQGVFSQRIYNLLEQLIYIRMYVESSIDFPEEEIDFLADEKLVKLVKTLQSDFQTLLSQTEQGVLLNEGMTLVILGLPNAGKSSLLNFFSGRESAIVTNIPGTTRDVLREYINIDGLPVHLVDTAGIREQADVVEQEGIKRAWQEVSRANHILLLIDDETGISDDAQKLFSQLPSNVKTTLVFNKVDLSGREPGQFEFEGKTAFAISVKTGKGIDALKNHLKTSIGYQGGDGVFLARRRHLDALNRAFAHVETGTQQFLENKAGELLAEDLRLAQIALNEITGDFDNEALLGRIFSSFCIGK